MMPTTEAVLTGLLVGAVFAAAISVPLRSRNRRQLDHMRSQRDAAVAEREKATARQRALEEEVERVAAALRAQQDRSDAAEAAFLVMADRIQVMALAQQQGLDVLEQSVEDPVLMTGLMRADHAAAQLARQAQTMKVICGAWPGRQWPQAVSLLDVVRGAQSRILEYQRVQVRGSREAMVEPRAVEALIHAVAELLDNATRYSPPTVTVLVAIRPVHSGAVIEIDDGGLGMTEGALAEAEQRLGGDEAAEGRGLGANPQLGLAAVGRLARRYGFSVKLDSPSAYGGVRAVVLVPSALLSTAAYAPATPAPPRAPELPVRKPAQRQDPERRDSQRRDPERQGLERRDPERPSGREAAAPQTAAPAEAAPAVTAGGLPKRRSRRATATPPPAAPAPGAESPNARSAQRAAAFMSSLQAGTRVGRAEATGAPAAREVRPTTDRGRDHSEGETP
ncbi:ATP-binding protein [Streptomyces orinoci]|uniref:histidine kinase n=1 Tax=Streptomyces orinoci TaxID=67339 RepID=A0ABV3JYA1_STRON|nr:ATP-binding protein [Streptomyces orinoci]